MGFEPSILNWLDSWTYKESVFFAPACIWIYRPPWMSGTRPGNRADPELFVRNLYNWSYFSDTGMADNSSTCLKVDIQLQKELETFFSFLEKVHETSICSFFFYFWWLDFVFYLINVKFQKHFPRLNLPGFGKSGQRKKRTKRVLFLALQKDLSTLWK